MELVLFVPALLCAARAAAQGHCPVAFGLCGLTLSWGAVPMTFMATRAAPDGRHRRLAEGRLDAVPQLWLAGALPLLCWTFAWQVDELNVKQWGDPLLALAVAVYALAPTLLWRARIRPRAWWRPLRVAAAGHRLEASRQSHAPPGAPSNAHRRAQRDDQSDPHPCQHTDEHPIARAYSHLFRQDLEEVAAAAAALRVGTAATFVTGAWTAAFLKCAVWLPFYQLIG